MSSIIVAGDVSGSVTLQAPSAAGTTTLTLPSTTDTLVGRTTTDTLTNKTLTNPTFDSAQLATVLGTAPLYMCRAWVNFNGQGTVAIRASGNVTSITDLGTGNYTVNITTAMPDINYSIQITKQNTVSNADTPVYDIFGNRSTTSVNIQMLEIAAFTDSNNVNVAIFR